jgi:D-sedoheptulose 7-phosphate isomerase
MLKEWKSEYLSIVDSLKLVDITLLAHTMLAAKQIFIAGNGGSYGNATHMAGDMLINSKLTADIYCLGDNHVAATALANDISYVDAMMCEYRRRRKDHSLILALSTSGKSKNILSLTSAAANFGDTVISITGHSPDPILIQNSILNIRLNSIDAGLLESCYDLIGHLLIKEINRLSNES